MEYLINHNFTKAVVSVVAQCDLLEYSDCVKTYTVFDSQSLSNLIRGLLRSGYRFNGAHYVKDTSFYHYIASVSYVF